MTSKAILSSSGRCLAAFIFFAVAESVGSASDALQFSGVHHAHSQAINPYAPMSNKAELATMGSGSLARAAQVLMTPKLISTTVSTKRGLRRERRDIGVSEWVNLSNSIPLRSSWEVVAGDGILSAPGANGVTCKLLAGTQGGELIVRRTIIGPFFKNRVDTITFRVHRPNSISATVSAPYYHIENRPSAGFTARNITLGPDIVSFNGITVGEGYARATVTGSVFNEHKGARHPATLPSAYSTVSDENILDSTDRVYLVGTNSPGNLRGEFVWSIPWYFTGRIGIDGIRTGSSPLMIVKQQTVSENDGRTTTYKFGISKVFSLAAATQWNPQVPLPPEVIR